MCFLSLSMTQKLKKKCLTNLQLLEMQAELEKISYTLRSIAEEDDDLSEEDKKGSKKEWTTSLYLWLLPCLQFLSVFSLCKPQSEKFVFMDNFTSWIFTLPELF